MQIAVWLGKNVYHAELLVVQESWMAAANHQVAQL
jgi:hypothetical protein